MIDNLVNQVASVFGVGSSAPRRKSRTAKVRAAKRLLAGERAKRSYSAPARRKRSAKRRGRRY